MTTTTEMNEATETVLPVEDQGTEILKPIYSQEEEPEIEAVLKPIYKKEVPYFKACKYIAFILNLSWIGQITVTSSSQPL